MDLRVIQRIRTGSRLAAMVIFIVTCIVLRHYGVDDKVFLYVMCGLSIALFALLTFLGRRGKKLEEEILQKMKQYGSAQPSQPLTIAEELLLFDQAVKRASSYAWGGLIIIVVVALIVWKGLSLEGFYVLIATIPLCALWCGGMLVYRDTVHANIDQFKIKTVVRGVITRKYTISGEGSDDSYYIAIEKLILNVESSVYKKYEMGDAAEFHFYPPLDNHILYDKKLNEL